MSLVKEAFESYAKSTQKVFGKSRMSTVGASEVGQCMRKIGYLKHDNPKNSNRTVDYVDGWGAARRGNTFEDHFFVPALKQHYGKNLLFAGKEQMTWKFEQLSATPDGILINQKRDALASLMVPDIGASGCLVIDCKTIDPRIKLQEPKIEHFMQMQTQLGCVRDTSKYQPDYGLLIYTNASFYDDIIEFVVKFEPAVYEQCKARAAKILGAEHAHELKPEGWIAGGNDCQYCAFAKACKELRSPGKEVAKKVDPQLIAHLADLAEQERRWDAISSEAETNKKNTQDEIKTLMREKGLRKINEAGISISWANVVGRISFDVPKLRAAAVAAGIDIQKFERAGEPSDRMTISVLRKDRLVKTPVTIKLKTGTGK